MSQSIYKMHNSRAAARQLAKMREELATIGEKERVLRERSASREVYRYLLDAHRVAAWPNADDGMLNIAPIGKGESNQLAV
ncbi:MULTISPECIES: hypothetical protein [Bradyrhizobium]|uniref:hypothetical protein n=1 Tax=Bradyrhizobium TaxID=374 RepID=UPI0009B79EB4|nr:MULTISPECIES: hypothetical protein [Bradyrhizobium]WLB91035.1 hypothetical protein QIH91_11755 [Bradyrhizobium japonicum USDA 135]GLR97765.1 hypothetical protein GCM10007858_54070 [Bradyrhizobium liaoningense]